MAAATIKASGRLVPVEVWGDEFWVLRPLTPGDTPWRAMFGLVPAAGPFKVNDTRFEVHPDMPVINGWVPRFAVGEAVAWTMIDEGTMAGWVVSHLYRAYSIKRADGTEVLIKEDDLGLRKATSDDMTAAIAFFTRRVA